MYNKKYAPCCLRSKIAEILESDNITAKQNKSICNWILLMSVYLSSVLHYLSFINIQITYVVYYMPHTRMVGSSLENCGS